MSDDKKLQWSIVEFEDGVQIVPYNWMLDQKKKCYWPKPGTFKTNKLYLKAVKKMCCPDKTWPIYDILFLASYDHFDLAFKKLQKAENFTDLTTDVEKEKNSRKSRHSNKRNFSSSSDDDNISIPRVKLPPKPPAPQNSTSVTSADSIQINKNLTQYFHQSKEDLHRSYSPIYSYEEDMPFYNRRQPLSEDLSEEEIILNKKKKTNTVGNIVESTINNDDFNLKKNNFNPKKEIVRPPSYTPNNECLGKIFKHLTSIKLQLKKIDEKVDSLTQSNSASTINNYNSNSLEHFPLDDSETLMEIETKIKNDSSYKNSLQNDLTKMGGTKTDEATKYILKKVFTNKLASQYSWSGGKGKKVLSSLLLAKIIIEVVLKSVSNSTEIEIIQSIKNWLRHASQRQKNYLNAVESKKPNHEACN